MAEPNQNPVVKVTKTVAKHLNVKSANKKFNQILGEELLGDERPTKDTDQKGGQ
jgi:hypothetical protein